MARYGLLALLSLLALSQLTFTSAQRQAAANKQSALIKAIHSSSKGFIDVDADSFSEILQRPRDFAVTALLTTTDGTIKCPPCHAFQPEFEKLAQQWNKNKAVKTKNVFVKLEFSRGQAVFQHFGLQHAPVLYTFRAAAENESQDHVSFEFNERGFGAGDVADHLNKLLGTSFTYRKTFNRKYITVTLTGLITVAGAVVFVGPHLPKVFTSSKPVFMLLCIGAVIVFNSGYMWNTIRQAPYIAMGAGGRPEYFAGGFQNQYGVETQIVAAIYSLLAFSFVALTVLVPAQRDPTRQRAGVYVWSAIFLVTFSLLFYIFRIKNPSYPFRLFF